MKNGSSTVTRRGLVVAAAVIVVVLMAFFTYLSRQLEQRGETNRQRAVDHIEELLQRGMLERQDIRAQLDRIERALR